MTRARMLLATAALGVLTLTACSDDGTATDAGDDTTASDTASPSTGSDPASPGGSETATTAPSDSSGTGSSSAVAVPLYFVGDTARGQGLFREFQQVPADDPLGEAAALLAGGKPLDPDYRTLWPAGGFAGVEHDTAAGRIVLTLAPGGSPDEATGLGKREAKLALQQMVYTLQGVTQSRDPLVVETSDGTPTSVFGIDTSAGVSAAKENNVLALVNITTPAQGAEVSGSFTATGLANSFEASGPWELRADDGTVVKSGGFQAEGWMDKLYPFTAEVDLSGVAPGAYTFAVQTDDPTGGTEGPGPTEDTKAVTVG